MVFPQVQQVLATPQDVTPLPTLHTLRQRQRDPGNKTANIKFFSWRSSYRIVEVKRSNAAQLRDVGNW